MQTSAFKPWKILWPV